MLIEELKKSFESYINKFKLNFQNFHKKNNQKHLYIISNEEQNLRQICKVCEDSYEYKVLTKKTYEYFIQIKKIDVKYSKEDSVFSECFRNYPIFELEECLKTCSKILFNILRRSQIYLHARSCDDSGCLFELFLSSLDKKKVTGYHLIPIENTNLYRLKDRLNFDNYGIKIFNISELDRIFEDHTNKFFYPYNYIDVSRLSNFAFIYYTERKLMDYANIFSEAFSNTFSHKKFLSHDSDFFTRYIGLFSLLDFKYSHDDFTLKNRFHLSDNNINPGIPIQNFIFCNDDYYRKPEKFPENLKYLEIEPVHNSDADETKSYIPLSRYDLQNSDEEIENIKNTISKYEKIDLSGNKWNFINAALYFLSKSILDPKNFLIWKISALESLLGSRGEIVKKISCRLAYINESTESKENEIKNLFKFIYNKRSKYIHGENVDLEIKKNILKYNEIDYYIKKTLVYMIKRLYDIDNDCKIKNNITPSRRCILKEIDSKILYK